MARLHDIPQIHPAPLTLPVAAIHQIAFYPVLFTQGPYIKWRTVKLPEPLGPRAGRLGKGRDLRMLICGDSSAAGVGVRHQSQALSGHLARRLARHVCLDWQVIAKCGNTTPMALNQLRRARPQGADVAVIGLGVNDITSGTPLNRWQEQVADLLDHLTSDLGVSHIYYSGIPPLAQFPALANPLRWTLAHQAERFDKALRQLLGERDNTSWITLDMSLNASNMAEDGFHPAEPVFAAWADAIVTHMKADRFL